MSKLRPLNWSQRVTMRMISDGRSPSGGSSYLDPTGLGIPGGTLRSLRQRGLIERYAWFEPGWVLTKAGVDAIRSGECDEPEDGVAAELRDERCGNTIAPIDNDGTWGCCSLTEGHVPPCRDLTTQEEER
ncbi:hypothetical protein [Microbacterium lacticum]|uniref:hypothetical protein n=1 Tax=Microbacterium lacticum TaxID=33885 RepID=UPI001F575C94|nr:hypothetical protein [Microbacterium lacticum]